MLNRYEQNRIRKQSVHSDMEKRVSPEAAKDFRRKAYPDIQMQETREMLVAKKNLAFLRDRAGLLDNWERETISRIAERIQAGSDASEKGNDKG